MIKSVLKIYDTAERKKKEFIPIDSPFVKIYCCGPTVYDYLHIGNFRGAVFYNFLRNWLEFLDYKVKLIYNFTDIDDKILNRSKKENESPDKISKKYIQEFEKDFKDLKLRPHTANPKATETIHEIITLIDSLIQLGIAYEADGDVFYSVRSFKDYGYLSGRNIKDLLVGARVDVNKKKKDPLDFSLWKKSKPEENWSWDSPWGKGRPGWHIECTAMIHKFLGQEIDIHGGGTDLIFPHHENEIAQSEAICNKKYVRYWIHNNMIVTAGDKMSKSLGNIMTMREFLKKYPGEIFKYLILSSHYRSQVQFSQTTIYQSIASLARVYSYFVKAENILESNPTKKKLHTDFQKKIKTAEEEIINAFNDDFATPKAFASFFSVINQFAFLLEDKLTSLQEQTWCSEQLLLFFKKYGKMLSLFQEPPKEFLKNLDDYLLKEKGLTRSHVNKMLEQRSCARNKKDFQTSDKIRKELEDLGIEIKDTSTGTFWEVKKHFSREI